MVDEETESRERQRREDARRFDDKRRRHLQDSAASGPKLRPSTKGCASDCGGGPSALQQGEWKLEICTGQLHCTDFALSSRALCGSSADF